MRLRTSFILLLLVGIASPAHAQRSIEIGPTVGYYRPLGHFDAGNWVNSSLLPDTPQDLAGVVFGVDARAWLTARSGVEVAAALRKGSTGPFVNPGFGTVTNTNDDVQMLTAQVLLHTSTNGHRYWIGAGPGVVRHAGDGYSQFGSPSALAASESIGAEYDMGRHLALSGGANALEYYYHLRNPPNLVRPSMVHGRMIDAAIHAGLMWRINQ